jgi:hypothetical protein
MDVFKEKTVKAFCRVQTQGLALARQALLPLEPSPSLMF